MAPCLIFEYSDAIFELRKQSVEKICSIGYTVIVGRGGVAMPYTIDELRKIISPIAAEHGVKSVSLFGSYSKGSASINSDVDLKIEKGQLRSMFQICGFRLAVEDALKLSVDLVTSESSDREFLAMIEKDEVLLYRSA